MRCSVSRLKKIGKKFSVPADKVSGAGWLTPNWWSNGGYTLNYKGKEYWHLCLEKKGQPHVGYNAVVSIKNKKADGRVWKDSQMIGCDAKILAATTNEAI